MKIIFLDIDGVLNHQEFYHKRHEQIKGGTWMLDYPFSEIDPVCVHNLNELVKETDSKIVISSTWRHNHTPTQMQTFLEYFNFKGEVIGNTPNLCSENCMRGNEIHKWICDNKNLVGDYYNFTEYVILDDDSDMLYWQRNNFLLVDRFVGLTMGAVFQAKKILNGGKILNSAEL